MNLSKAGSSPLTRGKFTSANAARGGTRLIPAHAGKTGAVQVETGQPRAHPRSRGENSAVQFVPCVPMGSSPLTWGKLGLRRHVQEHRRLIPAHAGKTRALQFVNLIMCAHPRSRGENSGPCTARPIQGGSSPLTRGKREALKAIVNDEAAHPRSRGENLSNIGSVLADSGSSPLTRGKQQAYRKAR